MSFGLSNFDFNNLPDQAGVGAEVYNLVAGRMPCQVVT
jgi:hypothetical protein